MQSWLKETLCDFLHSYDLEMVLAGFPPGVGSAWVSDIVEFKDFTVKEVSELEGGDKLVTVCVSFLGRCSIDSSWSDYDEHQEVRDFWGRGMEPFADVGTWLREEITCTVDLVLNDQNEVISEELVCISAHFGEVDFGRR